MTHRAAKAKTGPETGMVPGKVGQWRGARPGTIYIGRPGKGLEGKWGNEIRLRRGATQADRDACLEEYRKWLWNEVEHRGDALIRELAGIAGKPLGCFCRPYRSPCHGDVLAVAAVWAWEVEQGLRRRDDKPDWTLGGGSSREESEPGE